MKATSGFTLIELLVAIAIVSILAAVAIPSYSRYVQRGDLVEGTNALSQYRVQMEQYYQDNRSYANAAGACGINPPGGLVNFQNLVCNLANGGQGYTATATANNPGPIASASYSIDQSANQTTNQLPQGWGTLAAPTPGWTVR